MAKPEVTAGEGGDAMSARGHTRGSTVCLNCGALHTSSLFNKFSAGLRSAWTPNFRAGGRGPVARFAAVGGEKIYSKESEQVLEVG